MSPLRCVLFALPLLAALGCQIEAPPRPKVVNSYLAERADLANVRRIMVLPFGQEAGVQADCNSVRDAFVGELQKLRRFEVVPLPSDALEDDVLTKSLTRGRLSSDALVRRCTRYSVDGVFVGTVTSWRPYQPQRLGMRTHLVSVHSGSPIWAVDAIYDAAERTTIGDLRHFVEHTQRDDGNLHGWEMNLISPGKFTSFVAHRFVGTWVEGVAEQ
jgi:TolB-like protein